MAIIPKYSSTIYVTNNWTVGRFNTIFIIKGRGNKIKAEYFKEGNIPFIKN